jgi:ATP-dependent Clp protease adaptor protein ClpS
VTGPPPLTCPVVGLIFKAEVKLMSPRKERPQEDEIAEVHEEITEPRNYRVLLHNDDFTTKEFVVQMLMAVFNKSVEEATEIMWRTHQNGVGLCGVYPRDMAETKVSVALEAARESGFPLMLTIEEE